MEPLSILGTAGSILSVIDVAARCISSLYVLQQRWKDADMAVTLMIGQISTLKAALEQISQWMENCADALSPHYQLLMDLDIALHSSRLSISFIDDHVTHLTRDEHNSLTFKSKARAMAQDTTVQECAKYLNNQTVALNLLLTALNCRSLSEQKSLLLDKGNRQIMEQVQDCSSSLMCLLDSSSRRSSLSGSTDRASLWSKTFAFDDDLLGSKVYKERFRNLMKRFSRKRVASQGPRKIAVADDGPEKGVRRQRQAAREVLLLSSDRGSRIQLILSLQSIFDSARKGSIEKADKDEFIRYYLQSVCLALWSASPDVDNVIVHDERAKAIFKNLGGLEWADSIDLSSFEQIVDDIATIWRDKKIRQALKNSTRFTQDSEPSGDPQVNIIFHTLDMIADPRSMPTDGDVANMEQLNGEVKWIAFRDWYFLDLRSREWALPEYVAPKCVLPVLPRIIVIDLPMKYRTHKLKYGSLAIGGKKKVLGKLITNDYIFWCLGLYNLLIMTGCDDFIHEWALDIRQKYPGFDKSSLIRTLMHEKDSIFVNSPHTHAHLMWRYDDDEVRRSYDAIEELRARAACIGN